jgi:hypothetical protein
MPMESRLPPHHQLVAPHKGPLIGEKTAAPHRHGEPWRLTICGAVRQAQSWTVEALRRECRPDATALHSGRAPVC